MDSHRSSWFCCSSAILPLLFYISLPFLYHYVVREPHNTASQPHLPRVETLREKIISLELTKSEDLDFDIGINGNGTKSEDGDGEETVSEPATPIIEEEYNLEDTASQTNKKKKRKRTKKGKTN